MDVLTAFKLTDGTTWFDIKKAKDHCVEQMGAALKEFAFDRGNYQYVYQMLTDIVVNKNTTTLSKNTCNGVKNMIN